MTRLPDPEPSAASKIGSTAKLVKLGDRGWRDLLTEHHTRVRRQRRRRAGRPAGLMRDQSPEDVPVVAEARGSSTKKVEPIPSLDSTQIRPPMRRTSSRQM